MHNAKYCFSTPFCLPLLVASYRSSAMSTPVTLASPLNHGETKAQDKDARNDTTYLLPELKDWEDLDQKTSRRAWLSLQPCLERHGIALFEPHYIT